MFKGSYTSTCTKINVLRGADVALFCGDFSGVPIPDGSMVYLDPPYENRTKQSSVTTFDRDHYYSWAEELSERCVVIATEFVNVRGWEVIHDFGDTVVRHHSSKGKDGTRELLMWVRKEGGTAWEPPSSGRQSLLGS